MGNFTNSLKKFVDTAAVKTGEAIDITKKYVGIAKIEKRISGLYERLGKAVFNTEKGIKDEADLIEKIISQLDYAYEDLRKAKIDYACSKAVKCPSCGQRNSSGSEYCIKCGESLKND